MKNSRRNRENKKRAAEIRAGKPSGKSKYALKRARRVAGIDNPRSPITPVK